MRDKLLSGIYGILPADLDTDDLLVRAEAALQGGLRILQFRDKKQGYHRALKRAKALRVLTSDYDACFIVNDSVQMALDAQADGVHLGRDEMPNLTQLRVEVGSSLIVGVTCRADAGMAKHVLRDGADYISFGAIWASHSKPEVPAVGLPRLIKARQLFPQANICAIGGIHADNIVQVKAAGADCAAVISGLFGADDIAYEAAKLTAIWQAA
ncbi:MAG: thiamine phosphate synthase [Zetaproteobacteria bacterium CG12_big_fil_rev_8_21_14_0_65_54_13]|nr:MAG: thiamine phosphate synthase [Zetaproteobacteria bacterium CG23_combo_of_CG06-09_8_20_14_all_54_7]PIW44828.1 MAG: thiamine phosphate synthase [Zetaproteobacteria bacterium CG12_big_fil_rev_8_21_14_0_65_54_13]PIX55652.1 MAG: thiamine phosphate synthase [Zetaproteobacteria bacterium CG_4_10_14_3_um_filter_54_28]PJA30660.1 MAG: thiamine phosphate synthase [Zetaproteobacteria bacterium CG_4_9_14_3_um_filter_54_145]